MTSASDTVRELRVNGETRRVAAEPDTPLLYVLRNDLGLKGTRFGCGVGECAAGPTAAAIGNALFDALGVRVRDLPLTPERIAAAM